MSNTFRYPSGYSLKVKDPNLVGSLTGHKEGNKAFARYRDIDEDMKKN
jgi:hypothetical protein